MTRTRLLLAAGFAAMLLVLSVASVSAAENDCRGKGKKAGEAPEFPVAAAIAPAAVIGGLAYYYIAVYPRRRRAAQAEAPVE